jgi:hypothetical protein
MATLLPLHFETQLQIHVADHTVGQHNWLFHGVQEAGLLGDLFVFTQLVIPLSVLWHMLDLHLLIQRHLLDTVGGPNLIQIQRHLPHHDLVLGQLVGVPDHKQQLLGLDQVERVHRSGEGHQLFFGPNYLADLRVHGGVLMGDASRVGAIIVAEEIADEADLEFLEDVLEGHLLRTLGESESLVEILLGGIGQSEVVDSEEFGFEHSKGLGGRTEVQLHVGAQLDVVQDVQLLVDNFLARQDLLLPPHVED